MKNRRSRLAAVLSFMAAACFLVAGLLSKNLSHAPGGSPSGGLAYFGLCALFCPLRHRLVCRPQKTLMPRPGYFERRSVLPGGVVFCLLKTAARLCTCLFKYT